MLFLVQLKYMIYKAVVLFYLVLEKKCKTVKHMNFKLNLVICTLLRNCFVRTCTRLNPPLVTIIPVSVRFYSFNLNTDRKIELVGSQVFLGATKEDSFKILSLLTL